MKVGEVCNREVVIIDKNASIVEAAKLMREYHVGNVIVIEQKNGDRYPVGILTDRDIVFAIVAKEVDLHAITVGDAMTFELVTVKEEDNIVTTIKRMRNRGIRRIPVVNERGTLEGILAVDDVIDLLAEQLMDLVGLITSQPKREAEEHI